MCIRDSAKRLKSAFQKQFKKGNNPSLEKYFNAIRNKEITPGQLIDFFHFDFETRKVVESINEFYKDRKQSGKTFIYVPPEIQAVAEELQNEYVLYLLSDEVGNHVTIENIKRRKKVKIPDIFKFTVEIAKTIVPLQVSASEGVGKQLAQARSFGSGEQIQQFIEIS